MAETKKIENQPKDYDERIYRKGHPPHRTRVAIIAIVLLVIGTYFAWTKELPFQNPYELRAVFSNAVNIRADSPVRIAGVNVGKVTGSRRVGEAAEVTFTVDDEGRPIHEDAEVEIRPRIFLEGNFFLDVRPGSPSAPELASGDVIPIGRTATAVQLDEVLTALQKPDRQNLVTLLAGFGKGLNSEPTAADDANQDPDVQGETAGEAIGDTFEYAAAAGRDTAIVAEALQGTAPHDLSRLLRAQSDVFAALLAREVQLQDLLTNFNITAGAFAAESENLGASVRELAPTLEIAEPALLHLNDSFPALRAWARDIRPGIEELPATIAASEDWLTQAYKLLGKPELNYIAEQLQLSGPPLGSTGANGPALFNSIGTFSRCASDVLVPTGNLQVLNSGTDTFQSNATNFHEFFYAAVNFAGIGSQFDGNGPFLRLQGGGGPASVTATGPGTGAAPLWGTMIASPLGTRPSIANSAKPGFRTDVACYLNALPNLNGPAAAVGPPSPSASPFPP
jgi:ABC-type transporter Mla subunit MlaD